MDKVGRLDVAQVSKPLHRGFSNPQTQENSGAAWVYYGLPIGKSATQQVWKLALRLSPGR
jgi:hypothetical protein